MTMALELEQKVQNRTLETDVVIAGAGPGGALLGYLLARSGVRTVLLEKNATLAEQPGGGFFQAQMLKLFDQMELLNEVLRLDYDKINSFQFLDRGYLLFTLQFSDLPAPYNLGLNLEKARLLQLLIDQASRFPNFSYYNGANVTGLLREGGKIAGVTVQRGNEEWVLKSRLVVGADGRFSLVRALAGIEMEPYRPEFEVVWFTLPNTGRLSPRFQLLTAKEGTLVYIPKGPDQTQVGWVIRRGTYPLLKEKGITAFCKQLTEIDPGLRWTLAEHLTGFEDCTVQELNITKARSFVQDGLLLVGEAAHLSSPFSGQGHALAMEDAVVAHEVIMQGLEQGKQILSRSDLIRYETMRRPVIAESLRMQRWQVGLLGVEHPVLVWLRQQFAPVMRLTPAFRRIRQRLTLGRSPVQVATRYFQSNLTRHDNLILRFWSRNRVSQT